MSENTEGEYAPYVITLKGGAGFESPWLVLRAQSAEDAVVLLAEAKLAGLPKLIGEYAADFRGEAGAAPQSTSAPARSSGTPSRSQAAPRRGAAPQSQPVGDVEYHPEGLTCGAPGCGKAIFLKNGVSKAGNAYAVWTCPDQRQKNDGHFSDYVR